VPIATLTSRATSPIVRAQLRELGGMGSYGSYLVETLVTLVAVCALAFVILYGARKLGVGRAHGPIELAGQLPLDARRHIYLVRVGAQVLVVGVSEAGFTKLGEMPAADLAASEAVGAGVREAAPFSKVLARVLGRKSKGSTSAARQVDLAAQPANEENETKAVS